MHPLRFYRLLRELTQEALAREVGKSQPQIMRYERGEAPIPPDLFPLFAKALNIHERALQDETASVGVVALTLNPSKGKTHA